MTVEFKAWPKTPRLFRDIVVTEKLDGTNAAVIITEDWEIAAQSRTRIITPDDDNFGFARWVYDNQDDLKDTLGIGAHFGEWFGSGIQRGYGVLKGDKFFALFNVARWAHLERDIHPVWQLTCVPTLYQGVFSEEAILATVEDLRQNGSRMVDGFTRPEGVVVFHTQSRQSYKVLLENDDISKTEAKAA